MNLKTSIVITADQAQAIRELGKLVGEVRRIGPEASRASAQASSSFSRARQGVESISESLRRTRQELIAFFSLRLAFSLGQNITQAGIALDGLTNALKTVTGSGEAAAQGLQFVRAEAQRLGVNLEASLRQFVALSAAAQGTSLAGQGVRDIFTGIAEASVVLGLSQDQLEGALLAVQQIISKGKVSAEELRGQLGERLYGAVQVAARAIGFTTQQLEELLEKGLLPAEKFLPAFARQLRTEFGAGVQGATTGARAEIERFNNALFELKTQFATSGFLDALAAAFRSISTSLSDPGMRDGIRALGTFIGEKIKFIVEHAKEIAIFAAALGAANVGARVGGFFGPKGAAIGAVGGAVVGGVGAAAVMSGGSPAMPALSVEQRRELLQRQIQSLEAGVGLASPKERAQLEAQLAAQRKRLAELVAPTQAAASGAPGGVDPFWEELKKKLTGGADKRSKESRLPTLREEFDQSAALIRDGLERESRLLTQQLEDNLISIRDYYAERERLSQATFDSERTRIEAERGRIDAFVATLRAQAGKGDANRDAQINDQIANQLERIKKLDTELIILGRQRGTERAENAAGEQRAARALREELEALRLEATEIAGEATPSDRRDALNLRFADLRRQLQSNAAQFPDGEAILDRVIDTKAKVAEFGDLERSFDETITRMRNAEEAVNIQRQAGLKTEAQARLEIIALQQQAAGEVERLLPRLQELGTTIGPEFANRAAAATNELARMRVVVDDVATAVNGIVRDGFQGLFEDIARGGKSAKDILLDLFRTIEQGITKLAAQKVSDQLFGTSGGGVGAWISKLLGFGGGGAPVEYRSIAAAIAHSGGIVGAGLERRLVNSRAFLAAPRLHSGGVLGLGPGEVPTILQDGEEVLTRRDPRHRANGGGSVNVTVVTQDMPSIRRSAAELRAMVASAVAQGRRNL